MAQNRPVIAFPGTDPDIALIQGMASGDLHALDELYARHGPGILSYLTSFLNNRQQAEEVLQDVMLTAWTSAATFRGESKVRTWLLVIARNRAINSIRRKVPLVIPFDEALDSPSADTSPLERIEKNARKQMLNEALNRLPEQQREILELVFYHQLTGPEVAEVLEINLGTVKSRLHRAKEMLRRVLEMMGDATDA